MHQVADGKTIFRYSAETCVGICRHPKPAGFAAVFDSCGVRFLRQAKTDAGADCTCFTPSRFGKGGAGSHAVLGASPDMRLAHTQKRTARLPFILMDELGTMEAEAECFCREVCVLFADPRYYIIGAVKPRGTPFLPLLEKTAEASVFHLTPENRPELYAKLDHAQRFEEFLYAAG